MLDLNLKFMLRAMVSAAGCTWCEKPATCVARYERSDGPYEFACDDCCGHGNEDGHCVQLSEILREAGADESVGERDPLDPSAVPEGEEGR